VATKLACNSLTKLDCYILAVATELVHLLYGHCNPLLPMPDGLSC